MQTFLPYPDYRKSAACLDNKRLGKQRVECLQILNVLLGVSHGWQHHPAVKMWRHSRTSLATYGEFVCLEWRKRGFKDTCLERFQPYSAIKIECQPVPIWVTEKFCAAHRSNLLRKDPIHYGQFGWTEPHNLPYIWPTKQNESPSRSSV